MTHPQFIKLLSDHRKSSGLSIEKQAEFLGVVHRSLYNWIEKPPHELFMLGVKEKLRLQGWDAKRTVDKLRRKAKMRP